jgi:HlyD family secretion protein
VKAIPVFLRLGLIAGVLCGMLSIAACNRQTVESSVHADAPATPADVPSVAPVPGPNEARHIRSTGTVQAVHVSNLVVPSLRGPGGALTLISMIHNGSMVKQGDVLAEFDPTQQIDDARDARAKVDDLGHQIEQNRAQSRADAARRASDLRQAEADLAKAAIDLRKGETLSEIDRLKDEAKLADAKARVESLKKSAHFHDVAEAAGVHVLELQRDRQQVALDRAQGNMEKLTIRAPLSGMVAHENVWRNGSTGPMQVGDQSYPGQPLIRIFDPIDMFVNTQVSEPDGAVMAPGTRAKVRLDAYPGAVFDAHLESASPAASSSLGSPLKTFSARFRIDQRDPRLLPDLSAAVEIEIAPPKIEKPATAPKPAATSKATSKKDKP